MRRVKAHRVLPPAIWTQFDRVQLSANLTSLGCRPIDQRGDLIRNGLRIEIGRIGIDRLGPIEIACELEIERVRQQAKDAAQQDQVRALRRALDHAGDE